MKAHVALPLLLACSSLTPSFAQEREAHVISDRIWHLGDDSTPEWPEAPAEPDGQRIDLTFEARAFEGEGLLVCQQRHVNNAWHIEINGRRIATVDAKEPLGEHFYSIPAGLLVDGENKFSLVGDTPTDDITFGAMRYYEGGFREVFDLRPVSLLVTDQERRPLPARVTVTDATGELVRVYFAERLGTAVRQGVIYTMDGAATFEVPPGEYRVYAARGTEWSVAQAELLVDTDQHALSLSLGRELDTTGFVATDTHIHTLTHSGHGDSSVEERMVTLAGEGVELAIATDHNHNTDYAPTQAKMGLQAYFTPVIGNEVSTPIGHLNAFPLNADDEVPPHDLRDIVAIVDGIRARGAKAVILNHPRWPDHETGPHGTMQLNAQSGDWVGDWACPYDAMELINSQTVENDPMLLFRDWFALLNRGESVYAVASSDSHTVGGVVGQGRTYIRSSTDVASEIDVDEAAHNLANGHSSISMGIFVDARTQGESGESVMGELLPPTALDLRIAAPSWVRPRKLTIFANGTPILERELEQHEGDGGLDIRFAPPFDLAWPNHDFWMVALVEGDGVGGVFWPQLNNYTLGATNPIFFDVDGDGAYTHPRALAAELVEANGTSPEVVSALLDEVDSAVGVQLLRLVRLDYQAQAEARVRGLAEAAAGKHPKLLEWLRSLASDE